MKALSLESSIILFLIAQIQAQITDENLNQPLEV